MRRTIIVALALSCLATAALAAPDATEARVRRLLLAHHGVPERAVLLEAGPGVPEVLARLAADPSAGPWYQDGAVSALALFPSPRTQAVLHTLLADARARPEARSRALTSLAIAYGASAVPRVAPFLEDADPALRGAAVAALARVEGPEAARALSAARTQARFPDVVEAVERLSRARTP